MPGVAQRLKGQVDTHITSVDVIDGAYPQNAGFIGRDSKAVIQRKARPWFLVMDSGCHEPWAGAPAVASVE